MRPIFTAAEMRALDARAIRELGIPGTRLMDAADAAQLEPRVQLVKVNTDEAQGVGARLNIRSIPTLALFLGGREVARQAGAMGAADIVRWTQAQLARVPTPA